MLYGDLQLQNLFIKKSQKTKNAIWERLLQLTNLNPFSLLQGAHFSILQTRSYCLNLAYNLA